MSLEEAKKILGVETLASREELLKRYNHLFKANDEHGSFYLTSKVFRARERIEEEIGEPLETTSGGDTSGGGGSEQDKGPAKELDEGGEKELTATQRDPFLSRTVIFFFFQFDQYFLNFGVFDFT